MAGQGYKPLSKHELNINCKETPKQLEKVYEGYKRHVEKLTEHVLMKPSSYQFLKEHIYGLTDQQ